MSNGIQNIEKNVIKIIYNFNNNWSDYMEDYQYVIKLFSRDASVGYLSYKDKNFKLDFKIKNAFSFNSAERAIEQAEKIVKEMPDYVFKYEIKRV